MVASKSLQFFSLLLLLVVVVVALVTGSPLPPEARIVGGGEVDIVSYPWQVSVQLASSGQHWCGGVIVSHTWVLSAAHCTVGYQATDLRMRVGSSNYAVGGSLHDVAQVLNHASYNPANKDNDISALLASPSLVYGPGVSAVTLPPTGAATPGAGTLLRVSGWGAETPTGGVMSPTLRAADVPVADARSCYVAYAPWGGTTERQLCAGAEGRDACRGDSGGPLVLGNVLVGLVSYGNGCASAAYPSVYSDVTKLRDWVLQSTGV